jgi:hypothetical protein
MYRIQRPNPKLLHEGYNILPWRNTQGQCGTFDVHITERNAQIVGYGFYKLKHHGNGDGYKLIKKSMDFYIQNEYNIISRNSSRCIASDIVWEKLSKEYIVQDIIYNKCKCKAIYYKENNKNETT